MLIILFSGCSVREGQFKNTAGLTAVDADSYCKKTYGYELDIRAWQHAHENICIGANIDGEYERIQFYSYKDTTYEIREVER